MYNKKDFPNSNFMKKCTAMIRKIVEKSQAILKAYRGLLNT
ncbi:hypothetical protein X560_1385 [Listeria fleischmannii 1991]|uniref:Uncharacterized protein n=1 Tax=Listeria fleischmannii 1991 TaxID=1430899 RepID=A0A0J8J547_9LIST|nr:hypothetical protein X560_1385 [Listeria fleischmannii 1991]